MNERSSEMILSRKRNIIFNSQNVCMCRMSIFQWYSIIYADVIPDVFSLSFSIVRHIFNIYHNTKCQVHLNFQINRNVVMKICRFLKSVFTCHSPTLKHQNVLCSVFFFSWLNMFDAKKFSVFEMEIMWI